MINEMKHLKQELKDTKALLTDTIAKLSAKDLKNCVGGRKPSVSIEAEKMNKIIVPS